MASENIDMDGLIERLKTLIGNQFSDEVSQIYYGDVATFPPRAFRNARGEPRCVVCLIPTFDRLDTRNGKTPAGEFRSLCVRVVVMVSMIPYFEPMPEEAVGEKILVLLTSRLRGFLAQQQNISLHQGVLTTDVGDVQWDWVMRGQQAIRAAAIDYEATVYVDRQLLP